MLRIANAGGYWGDDADAPRRQLLGGPIDTLTIDALAEITMVLLEKQRAKDPNTGFATDVIAALAALLPELAARKVRVVTNAGGVNPRAAASALEAAASRAGLSPTIAVLEGDAFDAAPFRPPNAATGEPFDAIAPRLAASHAYIGARGIVEALSRGADIVITGRVADASLVLGPLVHEFGWRGDDWDRLAAGTVAGHVLECGAQATGGNATDWREIEGLAECGYPIAEVESDGSFVITKHAGSGGRVSRETVVEQLLYEIGDPSAYATPDVTVDFTSFSVDEIGADRVRVSGVKGAPPPPTLKGGVTWNAGFKASGTYLVGAPDAEEKARALAEIVWRRVGQGFAETATEILGGREVFLRLGVRDADRKKVDAFSRRFASFALSGPPGVTIPGGGRPPVQEVFGFWPAAVPRSAVAPVLHIAGETIPISTEAPATRELPPRPAAAPTSAKPASAPVPLRDLAFARSGDKGDAANIGVAARSERAFEILRERLTESVVRDVFRAEAPSRVTRYELPNLLAFNFVLEGVLGGGGVVSLRADPQGKTFAQRLLASQV